MIGSTRSSVKRATESWIIRSSSDSRERTSNRSVGLRAIGIACGVWVNRHFSPSATPGAFLHRGVSADSGRGISSDRRGLRVSVATTAPSRIGRRSPGLLVKPDRAGLVAIEPVDVVADHALALAQPDLVARTRLLTRLLSILPSNWYWTS